MRKENVDEALWWFRKALQAERDFPNVRTQAFLHFSKLVARHRKREFYGEVARLLHERESEIVFPIDRYYSEAALAMIAEDQGDLAEACRHACMALEAGQRQHSGFTSIRSSAWSQILIRPFKPRW